MKDFIKKHLTNIKHATKKEKEKELWDVAGILKNRLNKKLKYDLRPYHTDEIGRDVKPLTSKSKADKILPLTLAEKLFPINVTTGNPAQRESIVVQCPL